MQGATIRSDKGFITGLLGRNGSGKSSMLKALFGSSGAQECDVFYSGVKVKKPYAVSGLVNYLPQHDFLPTDLKLEAILRHYKILPSTIFKVFPELEDNLRQKTTALSGGEERLWSALIIILGNSRFSLLDELFTGIMPLHVARMQELLIKESSNKGFIITDHRYEEVLEICHKLYFMKEGRCFLVRSRDDLVIHGYLNQ